MKPKRICSICRERTARKGQRTCKSCHALAMRIYRKGKVLVPRELVPRGTLDARGRVQLARLRKLERRLAA